MKRHRRPILDPLEELADLLREAGAVATYDSRRIARAAQMWPDCLPPMFAEEALVAETWGRDEVGNWVARPASAWSTLKPLDFNGVAANKHGVANGLKPHLRGFSLVLLTSADS